MQEALMRIRLALTLAVRDQEVGVRIGAARALERIEGASALEHLALTAASSDMARALPALYAVADIGGETALAILLNGLKSPHAEVRGAAVKLLARTRDPRVVEPLIESLKDSNADVKVVIMEALAEFREPRLGEVLLSQLQDASGPLREAVITALGKLGDLRAVDALLPLVTDDSPSVRERVAEALGRLGVRAAEAGKLNEITPPV